VDASKDGPFPAPNPVDRDRRPVDRDQTLLEELVWSVALIGGVISFLVLVVRLAS
jgi:hypothetical protein